MAAYLIVQDPDTPDRTTLEPMSTYDATTNEQIFDVAEMLRCCGFVVHGRIVA